MMLPFKVFFFYYFTEQKTKKKKSKMECQATKTKTEFHRGVLEEANQHLHQLFWCLPVAVLSLQGVGGIIKLEIDVSL